MAQRDWKHTPKAKVYEAWSAIADGRVTLVSENEATVQSSDHSKSYRVVWSEDRRAFGSNDNASYWVGYMGYPIIAVAMHIGLLAYDPAAVSLFKDINWNKLNQEHKRKYDKAVEAVLADIQSAGRGDPNAIRAHADEVYDAFEALKLGRLSVPGGPPTPV